METRFSRKSITAFGFLIGITLFYLALDAVSYAFFSQILKAYTALSSSVLLNVFGAGNAVEYAENPVIVFRDAGAEIIDLCSGRFEIVLLFSVILATWEAKLKDRLLGCLGGFLLVAFVNPWRITVTLYLARVFGWALAEVFHDFLFRASLFLVLAGYYWVWLEYLVLRKNFPAASGGKIR